ncbi:MAG TPA: acyl-CoA thioesterase, partial [Methylibium sp.]
MNRAASPLAVFWRERQIRFSDCDPAGIVFYPQYFVMFNGLVEDWVGE